MQDTVNQLVLDYVTNASSSGSIAKQLKTDEEATKVILVEAERDWNAIEIDSEGANAKQDAELDEVIATATAEILSLIQG